MSHATDPVKTPIKKRNSEIQQSSDSVEKRILQNTHPDVDLIPIVDQQSKRAPKRSVSPENGNGKISKYNNVTASVESKTNKHKDEVDSEKMDNDYIGSKSTVKELSSVNENVDIKLEKFRDNQTVPSSTLCSFEAIKSEKTEPVQQHLTPNANLHDSESIKVEYPIDIHDINLEHVTNKFNTSSIASDNLSSFCTNDDDKLTSIYKIQNFEGVLQIQPNSLTYCNVNNMNQCKSKRSMTSLILSSTRHHLIL